MAPSFVTEISHSHCSLSLTKVLVVLTLLAVIPPVHARSCYYPNGALSTSTDVPCSLAEDGPCCPQGWQCLSNGLCYLQNANYFGRYTCTDPTWKSPSCPQICTHDNTAAGDEAILECTPGQYCCDANRPDADNPPQPGCCDTGSQRFPLSSGSPIPSGQNYVYSIASQPGGPTAAGGGGGGGGASGGQPSTTQSQPAPQPTSDTTTAASQDSSTSSPSSSSTSTSESSLTTSTGSPDSIPSTTVSATVTQSGDNAIGTSPGSSQTPSTSNKNSGGSANHNGAASVIIPAVVVPVVVLLIALIIALILWRRRRRNRTTGDGYQPDNKPSSPSLGLEKPPPQYTSPELRSSSPLAATPEEEVGAIGGMTGASSRARHSWAPTSASSTAGHYPYDPNTAYQHDTHGDGKNPAAPAAAGGAASAQQRKTTDLNRLSEIDGRELPVELPGSMPIPSATPRHHRYSSTPGSGPGTGPTRPAPFRGSSANEPWGRYYRG